MTFQSPSADVLDQHAPERHRVAADALAFLRAMAAKGIETLVDEAIGNSA
ncbi:hypothetical protein [Sorangium sp. So ce117]